jgi:DNA excision repair protein ERCC-6-like 2
MLDFLMVQKGYTYTILHGSLDLEERTKAVDKFNNDPNMFVFLISTRAGGVGLNITSANKV